MRTLKDVMTSNVASIPAGASLRDAATVMQKNNIGMLPIVENGNSITGVVTDRDIAVRAVAQGLDPSKTPVADIMTRSLTCCYENQTIDDAAKVMQQERLRRVLVLNSDKRPVGIVSLGDLARRGDHREAPAKALQQVPLRA